MLNDYPRWVLKHKSKNIEIRKINNKFYAYKIKSMWDKKKSRAKKVTLEYLGRITKEGMRLPKHKLNNSVSFVQEYGNVSFVNGFAKELLSQLKEVFPYSHDSIISYAILRLLYQPPIRDFQTHYSHSYLSTLYPEANMSSKSISHEFEVIGRHYNKLVNFFKSLSKDKQHIAIDLTNIFTESENISWAEKGYNSQHINRNQLKFLMLFSLDAQTPSFFKMLPGNVLDVTSLINAITESNVKKNILVGDRGFYSEYNIEFLNQQKMQYILPMQKAIKIITYPDESEFKEYFTFRKRHIWFREYKIKGKRIAQFLDKKLRLEEETSVLNQINKDKKTKEYYEKKKQTFGIISILTNTNKPPQEVYELYKKRIDIEVAFDSFKNNLEADKTYMQSNETIRGYFFINFLALYLNYKIINLLRQKDLLRKYSVQQVLLILSKIYKVKVNNKEIISEIPNKIKTVIKDLEITIT